MNLSTAVAIMYAHRRKQRAFASSPEIANFKCYSAKFRIFKNMSLLCPFLQRILRADRVVIKTWIQYDVICFVLFSFS